MREGGVAAEMQIAHEIEQAKGMHLPIHLQCVPSDVRV